MELNIRLRQLRIPHAFLFGAFLVAWLMLFSGRATAAAAWSTLGGNAQHTGLSPTPAQPLQIIHWSTPVDLAPPSGTIFIHYGSPVITPANTVIIPVKTGSGGSYRVDARAGSNGSLIWSATTDYVVPPHNWLPSYSPALAPNNRVYYAGAGGTVYFRDNVDASAPVVGGQLAFFGLANYQALAASFDSTVFINTPITADADGNIYFGFRTVGAAPLGLQSGIARIDSSGNGSWVSAAVAAGDNVVTRVPHQAAPALSIDRQTLYVVVSDNAGTNAYLLGLDPATLALKNAQPGVPMRVLLKDPRSNGANNASVFDDSSASPMVGPDGDVYYGVLANPENGSRGWLLHFSGNLTQTKTPGGFGWDSTAAIVPATAVASYGGASSYLIFSKYNNYAGADGGDGVNRIAVLDPNDTMVEPHPSSNGALVMKQILSVTGPTPEPDLFPQFPNAVREWCINAAAVDPITKSVMANSEDGKLYRWDLTSNTLSQVVTLSAGTGEAYTPTVVGADGTVYAINQAVLNAVGQQNASPTLTRAASRKMHGNPGPTFDLSLASTPLAPTIEPRSGGASAAHTIVFTFDRSVIAGTAIVTEGSATAGTPTFSGNAMIVPLTGVTNAQYVSVAVSNVASNDGSTGGSGSVRIGFLIGDVNGSRSVTLTDLLLLDAVLSHELTAANFLRDVNVNGSLTLSDELVVDHYLSQALPSP